MKQILMLGLMLSALSFADEAARQTAGTTQESASTTTGATTTTGTTDAGPTDAQIVHILWTADKSEIDAAKGAKKKAKHADVKKFADDMLKEHTKAQKDGEKWAKKAKVKPEDNEWSKTLATNAKDEWLAADKLKGAEFDKAYIDSQVKIHESVVETVKTKLTPAAKNPELKAHLDSLTPVLEKHLDHAKALQSKLSETKSE